MAATLKEWKNSKFGWPEATTRSPHWEEPRQKVVTCCRYYNTVSHLHFFPWLCTEKLFIVTSDGRTIVGTLLGNDQVQNLILNDAVERVYSDDADVEEVPLGLYLIRGDNLCLVGEYDAEKLKDDERVSEPIKPVLQQIYFWEDLAALLPYLPWGLERTPTPSFTISSVCSTPNLSQCVCVNVFSIVGVSLHELKGRK